MSMSATASESKGTEHVEHVEQIDYTNPHNCREYVFLPLGLTKTFDVGKLWVGDNSFIIRDNSPCHLGGTFVCAWAMEASIMGVVHGDDTPLRNDIISERSKIMNSTNASGVADTIGGLNRVYHMQLKDFLSRRKYFGTVLPPVKIVDEVDESGGCVPQLRSDMVLMVSIGSNVGSDIAEGRARLIARDRKDMHQWMRDNVVSVAREDLELLTGPLPEHFDESSFEFANWLDAHFGDDAATACDTPDSWLRHNDDGSGHDGGGRMIFQSALL